jgi:hypothetical protein
MHRCIGIVAVAALLAAIITGCSRTEQFDVTVRNSTQSSLTLALTKDGPPFDPLWASPEDLAIQSPNAEEKHGYVVLPPGKEGDVSVQGKFDSGTHGFLRVYRGDLQVSEMNAIKPDSPNRIDLKLSPGRNVFVIVDAHGRLEQHRDGEMPAAPGPAAMPSTRTAARP